MTPNAAISQSFATVPGQTYILAFDAGVLSFNTNSQTMLVTVNGTSQLLTRSITIIGQGGGTNRWLPQTFSFIANSATTTLSFRDQSTSTHSLDLLLDNVRVTTTAPAVVVTQIVIPASIGAPTLSGTPGDFTISMTATASGFYFLECSEDLAIWERIGSIELTEPGPISFRDSRNPDSAAPLRTRMFYRVAIQSDTEAN